MRKSFIAVCLFFLAFNSTAKNKTIDSLKTLLPQTTKTIDRFRIIEKILENLNSFSGNADSTLAIELLNATQALEFRRPKKSSDLIEKLIAAYRKTVPFIEQDRIIHEDMMKSIAFMNDYIFE